MLPDGEAFPGSVNRVVEEACCGILNALSRETD